MLPDTTGLEPHVQPIERALNRGLGRVIWSQAGQAGFRSETHLQAIYRKLNLEVSSRRYRFEKSLRNPQCRI